MKKLKTFQDFLSTTFIFSNEEKFDEDFRQILQILYFFGFYRPVPSTKRNVYGFFVFLLAGVGFVLGLIKHVIVSLREENSRGIVTIVPYTLFGISILVQITTFVTNQSKIVEMIKEVHSMAQGEVDTPLISYRNKSLKVVKFYTNCLKYSLTALSLLHVCGFGAFRLILPALYEVYADGFLYYPLLLLSTVQAYFVIFCVVATDLLHVIIMIRAGANFEILSNKLRRCTSSQDPNENEKELIACVKYHQRIIE